VIASAERLVLPGVGAFDEGMENLERLGLAEVLAGRVLAARVPILGICLGMQLMTRKSDEGRKPGLGWIDADTVRFRAGLAGTERLTLPHIGWNHVNAVRPHPLLNGLHETARFYFVHSYRVVCRKPEDALAETSYGGHGFVSAFARGNIAGVQFHPEKSHRFGAQLLKNFSCWSGRQEETRAEGVSTGDRKAAPRPRVIPVLLLKENLLYKTVRFGNPTYVGDPRIAVKIFNDKGADEIVLLDIAATRERRRPNFKLIGEIAGECFMPVAYGGGIRDIGDVRAVLKLGVEKVVLNTAAVENPGLVSEAARINGSSSVVVSIDAKRDLFGRYRVFTHAGARKTGLDPVALAKRAAEAGAGEIIINSIDRDGTQKGYDLPLTRSVAEAVDVPVVACGGAGSVGDFKAAFREARASAAAAGSFFVFQGPHRAVLITYPVEEFEVLGEA
jgi:cyclase